MNQLYHTFIQVVEHETFVKAADHLHLTQPTVTRQVQQLEQQLGSKLFERMGKRLVLNRAGELVYRYAKSFVALEHKMTDELNAFSDPESGTIYIGAGLTPSIYVLPPVFAAYRKLHPGVQFQVQSGSSSELVTTLLQREIDAAVVTTVPNAQLDLRAIPLVRDDILLVAAPHHPLTKVGDIPFSMLADYPFVMMRQGSGLRRFITALSERMQVTMTVAMETDSLESANRLVQHGVGLSFVPRSSVYDDVLAGRLAVIPVSDTVLGSRTITLLTRADSALPACAEHFLQELPSRLQSS